MLLSYYYGAEMSFLMNDSRVKEALELAFEREKAYKAAGGITSNTRRLCGRTI